MKAEAWFVKWDAMARGVARHWERSASVCSLERDDLYNICLAVAWKHDRDLGMTPGRMRQRMRWAVVDEMRLVAWSHRQDSRVSRVKFDDKSPAPERDVDTRIDLQAAILRLPARQALAVVNSVVMEREHIGIARDFRLTTMRVSHFLHDGLRALRQELAQWT